MVKKRTKKTGRPEMIYVRLDLLSFDDLYCEVYESPDAVQMDAGDRMELGEYVLRRVLSLETELTTTVEEIEVVE